ncbi:YfcC family protein, partial [Bifidobacterium longum]|nr:YfcC family protein [Bifidobacterium longum]
PTKSLVYDQRAEDEKRFDISEKTQDTQPLTKVQKRVLWLFGITFIIMIMGLVPWTDLNKHWTAFDTFTNWLHGIPFLGVLIGKDIP